MQTTQDRITRDTAITQNVDPFNRKWGVGHQRQTSLYFVGVVEDSQMTDSGFVVTPPVGDYPEKRLEGRFTSPEKAQKEVKKYLNDAWDKSDEQSKKQAGKDRAAKQRLADADTTKPVRTILDPYTTGEDKETTYR